MIFYILWCHNTLKTNQKIREKNWEKKFWKK